MNFTKSIKQNPSIEEVILLMMQTAKEYKDSDAVQVLIKSVKAFDGTSLWFKEMFDLIDALVKYQYDVPGKEQIKTPDRTLRDQTGDCDDYSVLWASILNKLDIAHAIKIVKYDRNKPWAHVYIVVPLKDGTYITLDNVVREFNKEVNHVESRVFIKE